jgi:cyclase
MFRPRVMPVLLLRDGALVKTRGFGRADYIGDPINAVRIFNELRADELVFLDIEASRKGHTVSPEFVRQVGDEANMPFAVGGGIRSLAQIRELLAAGTEKVVIGTEAASRPGFITEAAAAFGSSTIVVCMDVKRRFFGDARVWVQGGRRATPYLPQEFASLMARNGAGELIVQSIERDGSMTGYDLTLVRQIAAAVSIPVVALGGAGSLSHMREAYHQGLATGLAAGSMFVFHGPHRGVLINYPTRAELRFS